MKSIWHSSRQGRTDLRSARLTTCMLTLLVSMLTAFTGCNEPEMESAWMETPVLVDGDLADWEGGMTHVPEVKASIGLRNDAEHLYISLATDEPAIQAQVVGLGLTIWFDPAGGDEEVFGIRFPIGIRDAGRPAPGSAGRSAPGTGERPTESRLQSMLKTAAAELEIIDPSAEYPRRMRVAEAGGIAAEVAFAAGVLIYELKVPLGWGAGVPYAVGVDAGSTIGIGLKTPDPVRPTMRATMGGMGGGGGGRGGGGGGGRGGGSGSKGGRGGMGGHPGGAGGSRPEPVDIWLEVRTAVGIGTES